MINPTGDLGLLQDQRMGSHEFHFVLDRLIQVCELQEVDAVGRSGNFLRLARFRGCLESLSKLTRREGLHSAVGVVEYRNLARPQQPLGDDQRPN